MQRLFSRHRSCIINYALITADIIVDLQYGDCAKGKVAHHLSRTRTYTHVLRYNGGCNAGHTIFHEGKKFITHHLPAGLFFGTTSIIGPGCVLNPKQFMKELEELKAGGVKTDGHIFVAKNTHIITDEHLEEDNAKGGKIGTTKSGNGPAYRDKYARTGIRAESVPELAPYLIDMYEAFHTSDEVRVLCEGAQGFGLDIDWGDYPYVTSSHCTTGGAILNGIPPRSVNEVWGVAKVYETYVGAKEFEPKDDPVFAQIAEVGEEYGATTGRRRQCNWLDLDLLKRAIRINGVTHIVLNKVDVLREIGVWKVRDKSGVTEFGSGEEMQEFLRRHLNALGIPEEQIFFSEHKDKV